MIRTLQSKWLASGAGLILYLLTTMLCWKTQPAARNESPKRQITVSAPSWVVQDSEINHLVNDLRQQRELLAEKTRQLNEFSARLDAERQELAQVTQNVHELQSEFDRNVVRLREQEIPNLKRLAKIYAGMAPENAVPILRQMDEGTLVKIFGVMKDTESGPILETMGKRGEADAKLAASLSERLRLTVPDGTPAQADKR